MLAMISRLGFVDTIPALFENIANAVMSWL